jgi:hypothetical protein
VKKKSLDVYDVYRSVRKPMPPPTKVRQHKKETRKDVKAYIRKEDWK